MDRRGGGSSSCIYHARIHAGWSSARTRTTPPVTIDSQSTEVTYVGSQASGPAVFLRHYDSIYNIELMMY